MTEYMAGHARDQWLGAAQLISLNIAEGIGNRILKDRARLLNIFLSSAFECAAIQDVLVVSDGLSRTTYHNLNLRLARLVALLTRLAMNFDGASELPSEYNKSSQYNRSIDYDYVLCDSEQE